MFRTTLISASLLRSLVFGCTAVTTVTLSSAALVGCADKEQPEYWIEKLEDGAYRGRAIERLGQMYEAAYSRANKDPEHAEVKAIVNKLVDPLSKVYTEGYTQLDENTRESVIELLASFRDPRTEPALKRAFAEFGKRGRGGKDVKFASRAVRDMKLKGVAAEVFAAFKKTKPSTKDGAYYRDLNEALLVVASKSWGTDLRAMLEADFPAVKKGDLQSQKDLKDRIYQSVTAAQLAGEIRDSEAVTPLVKILLDPKKAPAANEALLALTKIGKPSLDVAIKLLKNQHKDLAAFHKKRVEKAGGKAAKNAHVAKAATIIGTIGRKEGIEPLIATINGTKNDIERAGMLSALAMLPHTPAVVSTFKKGLSEMPKDANGPRGSLIQTLCEPATLFFDPSMTSILVSKGNELKSNKIALSLITLAAIKTMDARSAPKVKTLVNALPKSKEAIGKHMDKVRDAYKRSKTVLDECKQDTACYAKSAEKNQGDKTQIAGMKALYAIGQHGKTADAEKVVAQLDKALEEPTLRYVASQVIDHHYPSGSPEVAKKLDAIVARNKRSPDKAKVAGDKPIRDLIYRLRARAQ